MLEIKELCVSYGKIPTVKNVSFKVQQGQIVGLVGESGSGKSTVVRSVIGLLSKSGRITSGSLIFENQELTECSPKSWNQIRGREISMIFQHPEHSMDPILSIGKQFCETMNAKGRNGKKDALNQAAAVLKELHMENPERILKSYPFELSGGMCQRVAIAMAMATRWHMPPLNSKG